MRPCSVCAIDLLERESVREDVDLTYPHPLHGPTDMRLDLCAEHLAIAESPDNAVRVHQ